MLKNKLIDGIVKEPTGGAHRDSQFMYNMLKKTILKGIEELETKTAEQRINERIAKFSKMGAFKE